MQTIHRVAKVIDNRIIIDLPPDFMAKEVEVTLKPYTNETSLTGELENEVDIGMNSPISQRTHSEIFTRLREKYESG